MNPDSQVLVQFWSLAKFPFSICPPLNPFPRTLPYTTLSNFEQLTSYLFRPNLFFNP